VWIIKKRALIIEDEENIAEAESLILGEAYEIHHAYDGDEGLEKARQIKPHVIILDLMLPKRNGYDICFNIRQDKSLRDTKIIMVTAKNQQLDQNKGMFIGADEYLKKPFSPEELIKAVEQAMKE